MESNESPKEQFERKLREVQIKKEVLAKKIEELNERLQKLEAEEERLEDEEFARTGVFTTSFKINIQITEGDVINQFLKDNPDLTPQDPNQN
jgi:DNA repair exonuclease SbcCD ATPase subunit